MSTDSPRLILASGSPRRRALLSAIGFEYTVCVSDAGETVSGLPRDMVRTLALRKAQAVAPSFECGWILAADTLVALDDRALGKPEDAQDAKRMLQSLSGRAHDVFTGICLLDAKSGKYDLRVVGTRVRFRSLSEKEIDAYIATGEPMDKAGAYAIQGGAAGFVEGYDGSYENIVGLPTDEFKNMYRDFPAYLNR